MVLNSTINSKTLSRSRAGSWNPLAIHDVEIWHATPLITYICQKPVFDIERRDAPLLTGGILSACRLALPKSLLRCEEEKHE
jgi:hypothetical protein